MSKQHNPEHEQVYTEGADAYDRLIDREDWQEQLLPTIRDIIDLDDAVVVESGAGTGRLTRLLAPHVRSVAAFDMSSSMIDKANQYARSEGLRNVTLGVATHDALPVEAGIADLAIAGWSVCYCVSWGGDGWEERVDQAIKELHRSCKDDGSCILIETLGTGVSVPTPPAHLTAYYDYLEARWGFSRRWIRTDYRFRDQAEAAELVTYFFGKERADNAIAAHKAAGKSPSDPLLLPECTGLWWRRGPLP